MYFKNEKIKKILKKYSELWAISYAKSLMYWDMRTYMPTEGVIPRSKALASLTLLYQRIFLSKEFKELILDAEKDIDDMNDYEKGVIRILKRNLDYYEKLPAEFLEEWQKTTTIANKEWEKAKKKRSFKLFKPYLEKIFELAKKKAEYLGYKKHPYDALLDLFEEGMTKDDADGIFGKLRLGIKNVLDKLRDAGYPNKSNLEEKKYGTKKMEDLNREILNLIGYDFNRGRLDTTAHPFTIGMSVYDVRITTRYSGKDFKESLYATLHEFGHALYELQIDPNLDGTPIGTDVSLGVHESQSRFWENVIGRSMAFLEMVKPILEKHLKFVKEYSLAELYYYINTVKPSLIRVNADEVTYNLHIMIRYDIEIGVLENTISVDELPEVWNSKMEEYIGVRPKNDAEGVLQDVHWSSGYIGYFPTYTVGNVIAAQLKFKLEDELGRLEELIKEKKFDDIRSWLKEKIHKWGATWAPKELLNKQINGQLNPDYFLKYLENKYLFL